MWFPYVNSNSRENSIEYIFHDCFQNSREKRIECIFHDCFQNCREKWIEGSKGKMKTKKQKSEKNICFTVAIFFERIIDD